MAGFELGLQDLQKIGTTPAPMQVAGIPQAMPTSPMQTIAGQGTDLVRILEVVNNALTNVNGIMEKMTQLRGNKIGGIEPPQNNLNNARQIAPENFLNNSPAIESQKEKPLPSETIAGDTPKPEAVQLKPINEIFKNEKEVMNILEKLLMSEELANAKLGDLLTVTNMIDNFAKQFPQLSIQEAKTYYPLMRGKIENELKKQFPQVLEPEVIKNGN